MQRKYLSESVLNQKCDTSRNTFHTQYAATKQKLSFPVYSCMHWSIVQLHSLRQQAKHSSHSALLLEDTIYEIISLECETFPDIFFFEGELHNKTSPKNSVLSEEWNKYDSEAIYGTMRWKWILCCCCCCTVFVMASTQQWQHWSMLCIK